LGIDTGALADLTSTTASQAPDAAQFPGQGIAPVRQKSGVQLPGRRGAGHGKR
jgi:hypothetical protein